VKVARPVDRNVRTGKNGRISSELVGTLIVRWCCLRMHGSLRHGAREKTEAGKSSGMLAA
jgi:hypothetical protein